MIFRHRRCLLLLVLPLHWLLRRHSRRGCVRFAKSALSLCITSLILTSCLRANPVGFSSRAELVKCKTKTCPTCRILCHPPSLGGFLPLALLTLDLYHLLFRSLEYLWTLQADHCLALRPCRLCLILLGIQESDTLGNRIPIRWPT